jgi:hypothetical protein
MITWEKTSHTFTAKLTHFFVVEIACLGHGKQFKSAIQQPTNYSINAILRQRTENDADGRITSDNDRVKCILIALCNKTCWKEQLSLGQHVQAHEVPVASGGEI